MIDGFTKEEMQRLFNKIIEQKYYSALDFLIKMTSIEDKENKSHLYNQLIENNENAISELLAAIIKEKYFSILYFLIDHVPNSRADKFQEAWKEVWAKYNKNEKFLKKIKSLLFTSLYKANFPELNFLYNFCGDKLLHDAVLQHTSSFQDSFTRLKVLSDSFPPLQKILKKILEDRFSKNKVNACKLYKELELSLSLEQVKEMNESPDLLFELFGETPWLEKAMLQLSVEFHKAKMGTVSNLLAKYYASQTQKLSQETLSNDPLSQPIHSSLSTAPEGTFSSSYTLPSNQAPITPILVQSDTSSNINVCSIPPITQLGVSASNKIASNDSQRTPLAEITNEKKFSSSK
jgi:hypothetical protein